MNAESTCIGCGCTDSDACLDDGHPCHWIVEDPITSRGVCSSCEDHVARFIKGERNLAVEYISLAHGPLVAP